MHVEGSSAGIYMNKVYSKLAIPSCISNNEQQTSAARFYSDHENDQQ